MSKVLPDRFPVGTYEWQTIYRTVPKDAPITGTVSAVGYALATWADKRLGTDAFPSQTTLQQATTVSRKQVGKCLTILEDRGWISHYSTIPGATKVYRLTVPAWVPDTFPDVMDKAKKAKVAHRQWLLDVERSGNDVDLLGAESQGV
ncbi:helix-turn-helix domain-containing protein [Georgenia thermotolerans]|uniref:Helix-turn-helix domain-containing protein n=1 Tax=Georgenia thermotolerans TaxID=527326 RepID=A0A7J5UK36_9MICO|nr:helix-turn-helix domain-containing protein [Georgenia thermotolerans]KAE8762717.1 hypothetical protein GB883_17955 [Georgenia thermotolerans]